MGRFVWELLSVNIIFKTYTTIIDFLWCSSFRKKQYIGFTSLTSFLTALCLFEFVNIRFYSK